MGMLMRTALLLPLTLRAPAPAFAANAVALDNSVFVERVTTDAAGRQRVRLEEPREVAPGDLLVFVLAYRHAGSKPADRLVITNPLLAHVRFPGAGAATPPLPFVGGHAARNPVVQGQSLV